MKTKHPGWKKWIGPIIFVIISCSSPGLVGQEPDPGMLDLDRIYNSSEFRSERFGPVRWMADGSGYTTLLPNQEHGGHDIVKFNPVSGAKEVLVRADKLLAEGHDQPLSIADYQWSEDGRQLMIFTNTRRVWRRNTRGDYWVLNRVSGSLKQLGAFADPATLMFAKFSPNGEKVAYVVQHNIFVEDLQSGKIDQITFDGSATLINGTFDWVYEEEFSLRDGFRWSPDGRYIAYWQIDASGVREFYLLNNTDSLYPYITPIQYPKVGEQLSACRVGIAPSTGGETVWMQLDDDPRNNYIARMEWAASSDEVVMQYLNRHQNKNRIVLGNAMTGKVRTIHTETDEAWLDVVDDMKWMNGGNEFTWISERTGWRHVYIISRDGTMTTPVTSGPYDVISVVMIDDQNGDLYFMASPDNATQNYLYKTKLNGQEPAQRLTPADMPGSHSYQVSPNGAWAIHTWSDFNNPPTTELVNLPEHRQIRLLNENAELKAKVSGLKRKPVEFFTVNIGQGIQLDGWMIKPYNFDPSKQYPVFFYVYGEPAGATVRDGWFGNNYLWFTMLAQKGYLVISIDNRGTPAPKGRDWRKCVYLEIGVISSADQAAAAREISEWPFTDPERMGIFGWSGGGSNTLNAMLRYPEIYKTGMSVAPVPDQRLYDAIYQERYMRTVEENPEGFRKGSPISFASKLQGNLLVVHGTGDDNVHYQGTEKLINEFVKYNKQFTMMAYPNRSHGIYEGPGTTRHVYGLLTRYLLEHLPPGPK